MGKITIKLSNRVLVLTNDCQFALEILPLLLPFGTLVSTSASPPYLIHETAVFLSHASSPFKLLGNLMKSI